MKLIPSLTKTDVKVSILIKINALNAKKDILFQTKEFAKLRSIPVFIKCMMQMFVFYAKMDITGPLPPIVVL